MLTRRATILGMAAVLAACDDNKQGGLPATQPTASGWQFINSPGMRVVQVSSDGLPYFDFSPLPSSVHMLLKQIGPLSGSIRLAYRFEGGPLSPVQGTQAHVSLMFQRAGDNWSGSGEYESYRWYRPGPIIEIGEHSFDASLEERYWRNVMGREDPNGFRTAMANAAFVGLAFGDPSAGATAHGVHGTGRFTILRFDIGG